MRNDPIDPTECHECNGSGVYEDHDGATRTCSRCGGWAASPALRRARDLLNPPTEGDDHE